MPTSSQDNPATPSQRRIDPALAAIVIGAVVLIVVGLVAIPLVSRRSPELAPEMTPQGVTQRFYQAAYAGDYATAYGYLAAEARTQLTEIELQQQLASRLRETQMRVIDTTVHGSSATVRVTLTHFQPGGLFDSSEWNEELDVALKREGEAWKIADGPFYLPPKL
ncbi:MAG TPA: hypothetical protein VFU22_27975 [Roseiflexaceae bacterium]|nr:hypothetical protein [Roseiflexaceae bacterium]